MPSGTRGLPAVRGIPFFFMPAFRKQGGEAGGNQERQAYAREYQGIFRKCLFVVSEGSVQKRNAQSDGEVPEYRREASAQEEKGRGAGGTGGLAGEYRRPGDHGSQTVKDKKSGEIDYGPRNRMKPVRRQPFPGKKIPKGKGQIKGKDNP